MSPNLSIWGLPEPGVSTVCKNSKGRGCVAEGEGEGEGEPRSVCGNAVVAVRGRFGLNPREQRPGQKKTERRPIG